MYKPFLTFRYLTRKKIVLFPILVVWLCVMMLIIVTSIMGGFVERVRDANRDLFGDIIISAGSSSTGFSGYGDLQDQLRKRFPGEILASTPVIEAYALIYSPSAGQSLPGLLVGVVPEEREKVSKFKESLFVEYKAPMQAVDDLSPRLPATGKELVEYAVKHLQAPADAKDDAALRELDRLSKIAAENPAALAAPNVIWVAIGGPILAVLVILLWVRARRQRTGWAFLTVLFVGLAGAGIIALGVFWPVMFPRAYDVAEDRYRQAKAEVDQAQRDTAYAAALPDRRYENREDLIKALVPPHTNFDVPSVLVNDPDPRFAKPADGCIVGSHLLVKRDTRGNFIHPVFPVYPKVVITVFPPSEKGNIDVKGTNAKNAAFTIVDDSHTGVYDVDSFNIYAPFDMVQSMAGMKPDAEFVKVHPEANFDPRCHHLLIKLTDGAQSRMKVIRAQMADFVRDYQGRHPEMARWDLSVQTWDEKQAKYLGAVENEKVMMTFILLLMSGVVVVVIFLIFYQIVRDKTRDIGIIKAVGGSEEGVAGIFLTYGLFVGIVGGGLGLLTGWQFVIHTNEIHEWIYQTTGIIIWDRSVYLFDRIPDKVYLRDLVTYSLIALVAGVCGAFIPAVIAASEDPVKAIRYE